MQNRIWTISNILSALRIVLVVPIVYCVSIEFPNNRVYAVILILVALATDFLDGYFARLYHQVTEVGKVLDPLADKIAIGVYAIVLVILNEIPLWYVILVLIRDVLIVLGAFIIKQRKGIVPQSNWPGKIAVTLIACFFLLRTLQWESLKPITDIVLWLSVLFMLISLIVYAQRLYIGRSITQG
ncbi:MAG: CDP-alcohol phosphatidyltransferase family protein [Bacteroidetes bacterium]|nr:CDP-alcohol phosphatidyltransferase family protein [Bacteroidota bacterium]